RPWQANLPLQGHNQLLSRPYRGDSFPAHRAVPPDGTAAPARRGGDCGNSAGPSIARVADCEDLDIGCRAATRRSGRRFNQRLPEVCDTMQLVWHEQVYGSIAVHDLCHLDRRLHIAERETMRIVEAACTYPARLLVGARARPYDWLVAEPVIHEVDWVVLAARD